jgi:hypothetical protein
MPIERAPLSPLPVAYKPPNGRPYRIKAGDNWWTIAKAANVDVWKLIEFNFKTRNPDEVNWYMRRNIGCRKATPDGKNYVFAPPMSPGTIYLPPLGGTVTNKLNYTVPGIFNVIAQPTGMTCWATVAAMMMSWRDQQSYPIDVAMGQCGTKWLNMFRSNQGLPGSEHAQFADAAGMEYEPLACHPGESWENMLKAHGPLAVVTANPFHARIMIGIKGDGSDTGTEVELLDPDGGRRYKMNFGTFSQAFEGVHVSPRFQIWHF